MIPWLTLNRYLPIGLQALFDFEVITVCETILCRWFLSIYLLIFSGVVERDKGICASDVILATLKRVLLNLHYVTKFQETEESEKQSDKEKPQKSTKKKSKPSSSESSEEESVDEDNEERKTETESKVDENSDTGKAEGGKCFIFHYQALFFQRNATEGQSSVSIYSSELLLTYKLVASLVLTQCVVTSRRIPL